MTDNRRFFFVGAVLLSVTSGCALNRRPTLPPEKMAALWQDPVDLEQRDLLYGVGGADRAPKAGGRYKLKAFKTSGTQAGYDVEDSSGHEWSVKVGTEARVETAVSRIVWAIGYHQPASYYVKDWTLVGDGDDKAGAPARFRLESKKTKKDGEWSWRKNPFMGTRPMAGLFVMMVIVNNWDLKQVQNPIYVTKSDDSTQAPHRDYMVRDLGASLGKTAWVRLATKGVLEDFEREPFIDHVEANRVVFHYQGAYLEPQLLNSVAPEDVRWVCGLLARLSPKQLSDAFRAGGFTEAEGARYVKRLQEKIAEGLVVGTGKELARR